MKHSSAFTFLATIGATMLIIAGIAIGFAAISYSVANPAEIFTWKRVTPLSAILCMVSFGAMMVVSGLAIFLDATTGYRFV